MSEDDVGWRLIVQNWLAKQTDSNREILTELCNRYIQDSMDFLLKEKVVRAENTMQKSVLRYNHSLGQLQNAVSISDTSMVQNLIAIFEVSYF